MVEKNRPQNDPQESGFFDDLTERVFKDYEPPKAQDSADETEEDDASNGSESQQAA